MGLDQKRVVLAHHWLMSMRGGEKTLEAIADLFEGAPIYALAGRTDHLSANLNAHAIKYSFIQRLPGSPRFFRIYLPLFPEAIRRMKLPPADLLISSDANIIKGVSRPKNSFHLCYCYSPPRYFWMMQEVYLSTVPLFLRKPVRLIFERLKAFDFQAAQEPDSFVAISNAVAQRIEKFYERPVDAVIYPPVDTHLCQSSDRRESYFLVVSELTPYKRIDLAVGACTKLNKPLIVIGTGSEMARLKKMAGPRVVFMGWQSDKTVREYMSKARAFLFPGEEDFGIAPVEAMASGAPVIAYRAGGVLDTVIDGDTGVFFKEQSLESLCEGMERFESIEKSFDVKVLQKHAAQFAREEFQNKLRTFLEKKLKVRG